MDDDQDIADIVVGILAGEGYWVERYTDPRAGLDRLLRSPLPRLVILDLNMRDMSGVDMMRAARAGGSNVPVVLHTSARPSLRDREALKSLGVARVLEKPLGLDALIETVAAVGRVV